MEPIANLPEKDWHRGFISRLFLGAMIAGLPSLQSFADEGIVYPDSAQIEFTRIVNADTITLDITNLKPDSVTDCFISDFTPSQTMDIELLVDGIIRGDIAIEREYGTVYSDRYTTRWIIGSFYQSIRLKYYSHNYSGTELSWSGGHPFPIFGTMPFGIGPPLNLGWQQ